MIDRKESLIRTRIRQDPIKARYGNLMGVLLVDKALPEDWVEIKTTGKVMEKDLNDETRPYKRQVLVP